MFSPQKSQQLINKQNKAKQCNMHMLRKERDRVKWDGSCRSWDLKRRKDLHGEYWELECRNLES